MGRWAICFGEPNGAKAWLKPWLNRPPDPSAANSGDKSFGVYWVASLAEPGDARIFGGFAKKKRRPESRLFTNCARTVLIHFFPIETTLRSAGWALTCSAVCFTACRMSSSEVMPYLWKMAMVLCPEIFIAPVD